MLNCLNKLICSLSFCTTIHSLSVLVCLMSSFTFILALHQVLKQRILYFCVIINIVIYPIFETIKVYINHFSKKTYINLLFLISEKLSQDMEKK